MQDYFIAWLLGFTWIFVAMYFVFVLLPLEYSTTWDAWKESLLLADLPLPHAGILLQCWLH